MLLSILRKSDPEGMEDETCPTLFVRGNEQASWRVNFCTDLSGSPDYEMDTVSQSEARPEI